MKFIIYSAFIYLMLFSITNQLKAETERTATKAKTRMRRGRDEGAAANTTDAGAASNATSNKTNVSAQDACSMHVTAAPYKIQCCEQVVEITAQKLISLDDFSQKTAG